MTKNKICKNCGCYDVCIFANPCRTEDCNHGWQPVITYCKNCTNWDPDHCHPGLGWCDKNVGYRPEHWFCAFGNARVSND
jgi:hypothetical protein